MLQMKMDRYNIKMYKRAEIGWIAVSLIIALIFFLVYSIITHGVIYRFLQGTGIIESETDLKLNCMAEPGSDDDRNGDGYIDTEVIVDGKTYDCSKLKDNG